MTADACCAGYFKGAGSGTWSQLDTVCLPRKPDHGPQVVDGRCGICIVGAVPWVTNFNVLTQGVAMPQGARHDRLLVRRHSMRAFDPHGDMTRISKTSE